MQATASHVRISQKKANLIAGLVRRKPVLQALDILKFTPKKAAPILFKVINSAAYNAKNNLKQELETLFVKEIVVSDGVTFKRAVPISRGRTHPLKKRTCHIKVTLEARAKAEAPAKKIAQPTVQSAEKIAQPTEAEKPAKPTKKSTKTANK